MRGVCLRRNEQTGFTILHHRQLLMVRLLCSDDQHATTKHEVNAQVELQIHLELNDVLVQRSVERRDAINEDMICASKRWQTSCSASLSITVTSVCKIKEPAHQTVLYGSTFAVSTCGLSRSMKLSFAFFPKQTDGSSKRRHSKARTGTSRKSKSCARHKELRDAASRVMLPMPSHLVGGSLVQSKSGWSHSSHPLLPPTHWQNDCRVRQRRDPATSEHFCCKELNPGMGGRRAKGSNAHTQ